MWAKRLYRPRLALRFLDDARSIAVATTVAAMGLITYHEVLLGGPSIAGNVVRLWAFATVFIGSGRARPLVV